jgi:hypothetical protein
MRKLSSNNLLSLDWTNQIRRSGTIFKFDFDYFIHVLGLHVLEMDNWRGF